MKGLLYGFNEPDPKQLKHDWFAFDWINGPVWCKKCKVHAISGDFRQADEPCRALEFTDLRSEEQ